MQLTPQQLQSQISKHKVKQGHLFKRYGFLVNEWKQRWIVLTESYLVSFQQKHNYSKPYELLAIEDIETLKSYFKRQQERDLSFRAECKKENFYLAARTNQDKWAWIGAIERAIDKKQTKVFNPKAQQHDPLREKQDGNKSLEEFYERSLGRGVKERKGEEKKGLGKEGEGEGKGSVEKEGNSLKMEDCGKKSTMEQQIKKNTQQIPSNISAQHAKLLTTEFQPKLDEPTSTEQDQLKHKVPQTASTFPIPPASLSAQKITTFPTLFDSRDDVVNRLFDDILTHQRDMRFFVDFIANLALDQNLQYTDSVVQACINHPKARYFIESLVKVFCQQTEQHPMNVQLLFMVLIHEYYGNYFYTTDLKVLVENLIRSLELYKSQLNHYYILQLVQALLTTDGWPSVPTPLKKELRELVNQVEKTSPSPTNQKISKGILSCI